MKIAQIANVVEKVPPEKYGGTERVVYNLTEELVKRGHDVTLFASGDSQTSAKLVPVVPKAIRYTNVEDLYGSNTWSLLNLGLAYSLQEHFDIIHDHLYEISSPTANLSKTPVVATLHGVINENNKTLFQLMDKPYYVTISKAQARPAPNLHYAGNVYHGLNMQHYPYGNKSQGYLLFVGRISLEKGTHLAMDAAWRLKLPLIMAAKLDNSIHDQKYFRYYVKPRLRKYSQLVKWVGEVDERQRNNLMKNALCLLHAVTWPEPFGLTLIESMACGCPVIAFNLGSIPEVVQDGKTGFIVGDVDQMVRAVKKIPQINRRYCRKYSLQNFSAERMTDDYEKIYQRVLEKEQYEKHRGEAVIRSFNHLSPPQVFAHDLDLSDQF